MELAHNEASAICKGKLNMPVLMLPLQLVPLSGPTKRKAQSSKDSDDDENEKENENDWEGDSEDGKDANEKHVC
jgi:hypothetical protein